MTKKLYVPNRILAQKAKAVNPTPKAISKAFDNKEEANENSKDPSKLDVSVLERLPQPTGYRILVIPYYLSEKTKGGIIIPDATRDRESFATVVAYVVKLGPDAYKDEKKFPTGPWCKKGDFVIFRSYSGTRFKIHSQEFRLIYDDTVEAVVDDPRGYKRI